MANDNTSKSKPVEDRQTTAGKRNEQGKSAQSRIGGPAAPGAKSTQPKQMPTSNNPQEQQLASYNRVMRRRMEKMGTYSTDRRMQNVHEQRQKRIARRKQKLEERRAEIRRNMPQGKITLGRKNTYFVIGAAIIIALIIILFLVLRANHMV
jgi:hypothetical protein